MRGTHLIGLVVLGVLAASATVSPSVARAQRGGRQPEPAADPADAEEEVEEDPYAEEEEGSAELRAPSLEPLELGEEGAEGEGEEGEPPLDVGMPTPSDDEDLLDQAAPEGQPGRLPSWTSPEGVFTIHGYFRVRGEFQDAFNLGQDDGTADSEPFNYFTPVTSNLAGVSGGCRGPASTTMPLPCRRGDRLRFANTRLRLDPTIALSDTVQLHMTIDAFDNLVLGSTPDTRSIDPRMPPPTTTTGPIRTPGTSIDSLTTTQQPPQALRNDLRDSIYVRRVWAEVRNPGIGELRFGRMPAHWGLGLFQNAGAGMDGDYSTDIDRVMFLTRLKSIYAGGSWDFVGEGAINESLTDLQAIPFDATGRDDIRQYMLTVAQRLDPEEQRERLARGDWVLNAGLYFLYRKQSLALQSDVDPFSPDYDSAFVRRGARAYIPDLWAQLLWKTLRLEAEFVYVAGRVRNIANDFEDRSFKLRQYGLAVEGEYRLLDNRLGIYVYGGLASGDANTEGLSARENLATQVDVDASRISTFSFHPNYRIDLILWRNILNRVSGAWYLRPGVSYDFIRNDFGQLLGARVDVVYSRAMEEIQAYGHEPSLGLEMDATVYYRSEDGPALDDGFYAFAQYGILFPFQGLNLPGVDIKMKNAQTIRLILGIQF